MKDSTRQRKLSFPALLLLICCFAVLFEAIFSQPAFAASEAASLTVEQTFKSSTASASGKFNYQLKPIDAGSPMPAGSNGKVYEFSLTGNGAKKTIELSFTTVGTYNYEIKQLIPTGSANGYVYDKQVYIATVYVKNAVSGGLTTELVVGKSGGEKIDKIVFSNTYSLKASDPKLMTDPPVKKTVSGSPSKDGSFSFTLTASKPTYPMPSGSKDGVKTITIIGSGSSEFGVWSYTEEGTYTYTIRETDSGESGYSYDKAIYTIVDVVKAVDGQLVLTRTVKNSAGSAVDECAFTNKYTADSGNNGNNNGNNGNNNGNNNGSGTPGKGGSNAPKTGDEANIQLQLTILAVTGLAAFACAVLVMGERKRTAEK